MSVQLLSPIRICVMYSDTISPTKYEWELDPPLYSHCINFFLLFSIITELCVYIYVYRLKIVPKIKFT